MESGKILHLGTVGCFYDVIDFNGYRGWLTDASTNKVYKIKEIRNDSIPLIQGAAVYYCLEGDIAFNVYHQ